MSVASPRPRCATELRPDGVRTVRRRLEVADGLNRIGASLRVTVEPEPPAILLETAPRRRCAVRTFVPTMGALASQRRNKRDAQHWRLIVKDEGTVPNAAG